MSSPDSSNEEDVAQQNRKRSCRWQRWRRRQRQRNDSFVAEPSDESEQGNDSSNESVEVDQSDEERQDVGALMSDESQEQSEDEGNVNELNLGEDLFENVEEEEAVVALAHPQILPLNPPENFENVAALEDQVSDDEMSNGEETASEDSSLHDEDEDEAVEQIVEASSEEDSENEIEENELEDDLLYPGAPLSVKESLTSVLTLAIKHSLPGSCIDDILRLITLHCPPNSRCISSLYKFKKYFSMIGKHKLVLHYYCASCEYPLRSKDAICEHCQRAQNSTFFIELPIKDQLQAMLQRESFFNDLQYRFRRRKVNLHNIEDIYDGQIYKSYFENDGFLSHPNNISFMWYTDGMSIYHSSNFSVWPLYFLINELSPTKRKLKENTLLAGVWFGPHKPNPNVFLNPFHTNLTVFRNQGYMMERFGNAPILMRGMVLAGVADLPAKAAFMRFKQFNGAYGCLKCIDRGRRYPIGERSSVQVYPFRQQLTLRVNADIEQMAVQAVQLRQQDPDASVLGVKGPTLLYRIVDDMVVSTAIDKMHGIDYGVGKLVTSLLFDSSHKDLDCSFADSVQIIDDRLKVIKPPSYIDRMPRGLEHHSALFKSTDYRHWLMILSIPVCLGVVDEKYMRHHCLLVSAVYLLNQTSVSHDQINKAERLLDTYVQQFEVLYGLRFVGLNIHQLRHLAQNVRDLGQLWVYACYYFEDLNGQLKSLIHGTRHAGTQMCSAASSYLNLPILIDELPEDSASRAFCEKITSKFKCVKIADEISPGLFAVGTYSAANDPAYNRLIRLELQNQGGKLSYFHRLSKNGVIYYSTSYPRVIQKESSYVQFKVGGVPTLGRLKVFVKFSECGNNCNQACRICPSRYFCIATVFERIQWFIHTVPDVELSYLSKVAPTDETVVFSVQSLSCLCYAVNVEDSLYLATPMNDLLEAN